MTQLVSFSGAFPVPWPTLLWVDDPARPGSKRALTGDAVTEAVIIAAGGALVDAAPSPSARQMPAVWNGSAWTFPAKAVSVRQAEMDAALRARFKALLGQGHTVNGVVIDLEGESFVRLREGGEAIAGGGGVSAVTVRRQAIDLPNQAAANAVRAAARGRYLELAEAERAVFDAIFATPTPSHDDLDLIDIEAGTVDGEGGWP